MMNDVNAQSRSGDKTVTPETFYRELVSRFSELLKSKGITGEQVEITTRSLTPQEAIGITKRRDFPIITGKDVMVQASCMGSLGQAFTDAPSFFKGTLGEICALDVEHGSHNRGLFIAALNAVMKYLGMVECTVHCRCGGPEQCAVDAEDYIARVYGHPRIGLIGYQPSLLERLSARFPVRAADLSPVNIGQTRYHVLVEDGGAPGVSPDICEWADLVLCTGSTVCNGSIVDFLHLKDKILFYGTTLAGAAALLGLPRLCFADKYQ